MDKFQEPIAKLLVPEKTMILGPFLSGSLSCHDPCDEVDPGGSAEEHGRKPPQKRVFTGAMSFTVGSQGQIRHIPWKRAFDIVFCLFALILCAPLFILIFLGIKLSTGGSVIYAHERVGRGGKKFRCYKFRSMYPDAEQRLEDLLAMYPHLKQEWDKHQKLKNDPRITIFGNFLRKSSLDELPQFYNVLKGDLSVVGPRPVVEEELRTHYGIKAHKILSIRPGLTGIWQVSGRNNTDYSTRIRMDEQYVDTFSFFLDLKLILNTIPKMINSEGAY